MNISRKGRLVFALAALVLVLVPAAAAQKGQVELGFHYGRWSVNLLKPAIENLVADFADQIKDNMIDKIREEHPGFREIASTREFEFDSGGPNYGFELRWYPAGEQGSFSLGFAFEKTTIKIGIPRFTTSLTLEEEKTGQQAGFAANAGGSFVTKPLAFLLSLRWDVLPTKRIHPYFTFGLGLAGEGAILNATLDYHFDGVLTKPDGTSETISEATTKTVQQLIDEDKARRAEGDTGPDDKPFEMPLHFLPFLQLHFGLKGVITKNVHALADFGILDGFVLRAGLAVRI